MIRMIFALLLWVGAAFAAGPMAPVISITPEGTDPRAKVKVESSIPSEVDYFYFYRGTHPYFNVSPTFNMADQFRVLDALVGIFIVD